MTIGFGFFFATHVEIVYLQRKKLGVCYRYKSVQSHDGMAEGLDIRQAWGWRPALLPRSRVRQ